MDRYLASRHRSSLPTESRRRILSLVSSWNSASGVVVAAAFLLIGLINTSPAFAGRYELVKGKGVEVCEAYGKNLNSFKPSIPMICERQINPEANDFRRPEWKELDAWENRGMVRNVESFLGNHPRGNPKNDMAQWEDGVKDRIKIHHLKIELAQVDIDNDGKNENIIKYYDGSCPMTRHYGTPLLVLSEDKNDVGIKTVSLMQNNSRVVSGWPIAGGWEFSMYDVFLYRNKVYFDRWSQSKDQTSFLKVFVTETNILANGVTKEVCRYQFKSSK